MSKFLVGNIKGPKGDKGEPGATGPKGEQGIQGPVGPAGGVNSVNGKKGDVNIADALGYTPAGGENLVLDSTKEVSTSVYFMQRYVLSTPLEIDKTYTATIYGELGEGKESFDVYSDYTGYKFLALKKVSNGVYSGTGVLYPNGIIDNSMLGYIKVYAAPGQITDVTSKIHKIKIERGTVPNPVWTPAPEDVVVKGEVDGRNLIVLSKCINGFIDGNGNVAVDSASKRTDYIEIKSKGYIIVTLGGTANRLASNYGLWCRLYFYDGDKKPIGRGIDISNAVVNSYSTLSKTAEIPNDSKYVICSFQYYNIDSDFKIKMEYGNIATPWTPAPEDVVVRSELEQAVAGENLLNGTNTTTVLSDGLWSKGNWREASAKTGTRTSIDITDCPNPLIKKGWRNYSTLGVVDIGQNNIPVEYRKTYTLSCYAKGAGELRLQFGNSNYDSKVFDVSNVWEKYVFSHTFIENDSIAIGGMTNVFFGASGENSNVEICGMKLEYGIAENPVYIPSPYDYQKDILARLAAIEAKLSIQSADESPDDMEVVSPMQEGNYMEDELE